jgi:hypothetical protein
MLCMINGSYSAARDIAPIEYIGMMSTPFTGNTIMHAVNHDAVWCLDNGCFNRYEPQSIVRMLERWQGLKGCKFAVVPDVVCNHDETMLLFRAWIGTYTRLGYPAAFVLQNGVTPDSVPYGSIAAVFIGGDDQFKYNDTVREIVKRAKQRGLWVHMGRVNSARRIRYAAAIGCDSTDGTAVVRFQRQRLAELIPYHIYKQKELLA